MVRGNATASDYSEVQALIRAGFKVTRVDWFDAGGHKRTASFGQFVSPRYVTFVEGGVEFQLPRDCVDLWTLEA